MMEQLVILIDQKSTVIRNACQAAQMPYLLVTTGFDSLLDETLELIKMLVSHKQDEEPNA